MCHCCEKFTQLPSWVPPNLNASANHLTSCQRRQHNHPTGPQHAYNSHHRWCLGANSGLYHRHPSFPCYYEQPMSGLRSVTDSDYNHSTEVPFSSCNINGHCYIEWLTHAATSFDVFSSSTPCSKNMEPGNLMVDNTPSATLNSAKDVLTNSSAVLQQVMAGILGHTDEENHSKKCLWRFC